MSDGSLGHVNTDMMVIDRTSTDILVDRPMFALTTCRAVEDTVATATSKSGLFSLAIRTRRHVYCFVTQKQSVISIRLFISWIKTDACLRNSERVFGKELSDARSFIKTIIYLWCLRPQCNHHNNRHHHHSQQCNLHRRCHR